MKHLAVATTLQPAPALELSSTGQLVVKGSGQSTVLRGINSFGWENGQFSVFDGMWAGCDDNSTWCATQDGEIPPYQYPSASIGATGQQNLNSYYW